MKKPGLRRGNWSVAELERLRQLLPRRGIEGMAALLRRSPASLQRKAMEMLRVPMRRGDWTSSDDQLLREAWGALDLRLLAAALGRPATEVRRRADELRARVRTGPWSRAEVLLLKDLYGTRSDGDLEVCLSRPPAAIHGMAVRYCLAKDKRFVAREQRRGHEPGSANGEARPGRRMPRWTADEVVRLREIYHDRDNLAVARILGRTVTSVANKANQLGLKKGPAVLTDIGRTNVGLRYGRHDADGVVGEA